jgi:Chaperone of endosialidase
MRHIGKFLAIAVSILLLVSLCSAQQTSATTPPNSEPQGSPALPPGPVLGGDGIPYYIPLWRTNDYLLSSVIYQNGSSIGIGTTTPAATLDVNGGINTAQTYEVGGSSVLSIGSPSDANLFLGAGAGSSNIAGQGRYNTFSGSDAGNQNTSGNGNTFYGSQAGVLNTTGEQNTFSGSEAGFANTTGNYNTFSGAAAGDFNTTGNYNTFSGAAAGVLNTTGSNNTFFGATAGNFNTTGSYNTFYGWMAGYSNTTGGGNTFSGDQAGSLNTIGSGNTFYGAYAGSQITTGSNNTFLGLNAGGNNVTGSNDVYIAYGGALSGNESNTIRIGEETGQAPQTAAYIAGIYGVNVGGVPVQINENGQLGAQTSSLRFKEHVRDMGDSTSALMQLRPVTFFYKPEYDKGDRTLQYGLIAEEVAKVYPELVAYDNDGQPYGVRYQYLSTILLNEVQKQYRRAETQAQVIQAQEEKIEDLEQRLARLESYVAIQMKTASDNPPQTTPGSNGGLQ